MPNILDRIKVWGVGRKLELPDPIGRGKSLVQATLMVWGIVFHYSNLVDWLIK